MEPVIRLAVPEDKEGILNLLNSVFSGQQRTLSKREEKYFQWKFYSSPFGKSIVTVASIDDTIVGVVNLWPWEFTIRGQVIKAMQPCDSVVHPSARGKGLFRKLRMYDLNHIKNSDISFLFNFPNNQSISTYKSLGWNYLGKINWWVKILGPLNTIKSLIQKEEAVHFHLPDHYQVDADLLDKLSKETVSFEKFIKIRRIEGFHSYRYLEHPSREYGMIYYEMGKGSAAAIFTINQKGAVREMVVVDFIGSEKHTEAVLNIVLEEAKKLKADLVALMADTSYIQKSLWLKGFIKTKNKNMVMLPLKVCMEYISKDSKSWDMHACLHDSI